MGVRRNLKELKNKYKGQDIYVIGSGASLDYVEASFFDNKITVGVNNVWKKFPVTYFVKKEDFKREDLSRGNSILIVTNYFGADSRNIKHDQFQDEGKLYYYFEHEEIRHLNIDVSMVGTDKIVVSFSTITSAIHIAAYLGTANIILCGHDCACLDGEANFKGYHPTGNPNEWYRNWVYQIMPQTIILRKKIREVYGCNIYSLNPFIGLDMEGHKID